MVLNKNFACNLFCNIVWGLQLDKKIGRSNTEDFCFWSPVFNLVHRLKWNIIDTNPKESKNTLVYVTELGCCLEQQGKVSEQWYSLHFIFGKIQTVAVTRRKPHKPPKGWTMKSSWSTLGKIDTPAARLLAVMTDKNLLKSPCLNWQRWLQILNSLSKTTERL